MASYTLSTLDELNESLDNQDKQDDKLIETIKDLNLLAPKLEERKKEREAKRNLTNTAPSDFVDEYAPKLLQFEKRDEEKLRNSIPSLVNSAKNVSEAVNSTGGAASPYISGAYVYTGTTNNPDPWFDAAMQPFNILAEYKLQRTTIPIELDKLYQGLGDMFSAALQSADKPKTELENQSDSRMAMRNFLQSFWGNLLSFARQNDPPLWRRYQKSKLSQPDTRYLVAKSLSSNPNDERKLMQLLQDMSEIYKEMSSPQIGKNLALDNLSLFNTLFTRWFLLTDDIVKILNIFITR
jgi:hypothetical protein